MRLTAKIELTYWWGEGVRKIGTNPRWSLIHFAGGAWRFDTSKRPQKPYTMLGTVANRSTTAVRNGFSWRGAYSLIISAIAMDTGAAMATDTRAIAMEPTRSAIIPKCPESGLHAGSSKSPIPQCAARKA